MVSDVKGNPLAGVSIYNDEKTVGTTTDFYGGFRIKVTEGTVLIFHTMGYQKHRQKITAGMLKLNIHLEEQRIDLDGVELVARSNINDIDSRKATGEVAQIDVKQMINRPSINLMESLQGQVAGVSVQSSAELGKPLKIRIRGTSTLSIKSKADAKKDTEFLDNMANQPLFVVDGQVVSPDVFANLNPNDIKEMKVLKDAVANALYGIKAANGVIEVSTQRGIDGKTQYRFNARHGMTLIGKPNVAMMDTHEKLAFEFASKQKELPGYRYSEEYIRLIHGSKPDLMNRITEGQRKLDSLKQINTNWFKELMRIDQYSTYNISMRGGNEKNRYYISGNFTHQGGKLEHQSLKRLSARLNYDLQLSKKLTVYFNSSLTVVENNSPNSSSFSPASLIYRLNPYEQPNSKTYLVSFNNRRKYGDLYNQFHKKEDKYQFNFSTNVFWKISNSLDVQSAVGINYNIDNSLKITPRTAVSQLKSAISREKRGVVEKGKNIGNNQSLNVRVNYHPFMGKSQQLFLSANVDYLKSSGNAVRIKGHGLPSKLQSAAGINNDLTGRFDTTTTSSNATTAQLGFGFSALYTLKKLDVYGSYKADASSMMPTEKRWNYFWSVGMGYQFLANNPMRNPWLSSLKLRTSYGVTASLAGVDAALVHPVYHYGGSTETYLGYRSFYLKQLFNKDLKPERNATINVGLDFQFFKRLNLSLTAYHRRTDQMLITVPIAPSNGFTSQLKNIGVLQNQGIEITLGGYFINNKDFAWHTSFNASYNQNKIIDLYEGEELFLSGEEIPYPTYKEGMSADVVYGLKDVGVSAIDGMNYYERKDGTIFNGAAEKAKRSDFHILGTRTPPIQGGWHHHFRYRKWQLSVQLYYNFGGIKKYANTTAIRDADDAYRNGFKGQLAQTWLKVGDPNKKYKTLFGRGNNIYQNLGYASTSTVGSTDFVRINNISVSYEMPTRMIKKIAPFFKAGNFMAQFKNIATFSGFKGGDPEAAELIGQVQPIITLGVNFNF